MSLTCKVQVQIVVQVERTFYGEYDGSVVKMFESVAGDAVRLVQRDLGNVATLVGNPVVVALVTDEREVTLPKEPA